MSFSGRRHFDSQKSQAFLETLDLLEWSRLCEHLSEFATTVKAKKACKEIVFPSNLHDSQEKLNETIEIGSVDLVTEGGISFHGVHDLDETLMRCSKGGVVSGEDLLEVAETLSAARRLRRQLNHQEINPTLSKLFIDFATLPNLEHTLKFVLEEGGRIANRASKKLEDLRLQSQKLIQKRNDLLQECLRSYGSFLQDKVISERNGRPVLSFRAVAISKISGLVHDTSSSGNTIFIEPQPAIFIGNQIASLDVSIRKEEYKLLAKWSLLVGNNEAEIQLILSVLLTLELALARARYCAWLDCVPPKLEDNSNSHFSFKGFRHPLLVWQHLKNDGPQVVPISIDVPPSVKVIAITGPNTGGKTVTLKSIGLAILMAKAGFLIPSEKIPTIPWCINVFADIGDEQSLQQNLSTFSGHVKRIGRILDSIDKSDAPSVVLLDEVGAGTDPNEGSALANAILRKLADRASLTFATTHFGELKSIKYSDSRFENASVEFNSETLSPTYKVLWGIPGRSNAFAIASKLGLPKEVVSFAKKLLESNSGAEVDEVIKGLEEQRQRQQSAAEEAVALLAKTELLHEEILSRWNQQKKISDEVQNLGRIKLKDSIHEGQKEVRSLIHRLRKAEADGETARTAGQRFRQIISEHEPSYQAKDQKGWIPKVGDQIRVLALGKAGYVIAISEDGKQLTVRCGVLRSKVDLAAVESLDGRKPIISETEIIVKAHLSDTSSSSIRTSRNTLDIRGLRVNEAEVVVEEKLRSVIGPLWVVHGIGTGKLKRGLRDWLSTLPYIDRVIDAGPEDGGEGCTIIWLK